MVELDQNFSVPPASCAVTTATGSEEEPDEGK
jgi:hypothetical protein